MKGLPYEVKVLVQKARESALLAVETYNRPTANFRSGAYVVLMAIAWTALFHAIFFRRRIKPFYRKKDSQRYMKIEGEPKRWELKECLDFYYKMDNPPSRKNLEFFVGLRNKIEHCSLAQLDPAIFGECQSLLLNFENLLIAEFGEKHAMRTGLTFALQFSKLAHGHSSQKNKVQQQRFKIVKQYVDNFRSALSSEIQSSLDYSFKVFLVPKIGNNASSDAVAVEWVKYDVSKPEEMKQYEKVVAMIKPKGMNVANLGLLKPGQVAAEVRQKTNKKFGINYHAWCYKHFGVRPLKGAADPSNCDSRYCQYDDLHKDYAYTKEWVGFLVEKLNDPQIYELMLKPKTLKSGCM